MLRQVIPTVCCLFAFGLLTLGIPAHANAWLVAYFPLTDGPDGSTALTADDIIDDPTHGVSDATANNSGDSWVFDVDRNRIVLSTTEGTRFTGGTQDINLATGFTWSVWAKVSSSNLTDTGADVIIGTRSGFNNGTGGRWHKVDLAGISNWHGTELGYTNLADDTWHNIVYTGNASSRSIYIDGVLVDTDNTLPDGTTYNGKFEFGGSAQFSEDITGLLSDVAVWDVRLGTREINNLAAGVDPRFIPEPASLALLGLGGLLLTGRRR